MSGEKQVSGNTFDLTAFRKERDENRGRRRRNWQPNAEDIGAAYRASERDFSGADLRLTDLRGIDLCVADLSGADLRGANLSGVDLRGANLRGANLSGVDLRGANLSGVDLRGANLRGADLFGANLSGASGVKFIYGVGDGRRMVFAYIHQGEIRIQAGCRNGTPKKIRSAVKEDYIKDSDGYRDYMDTVLYLEKWGKRMLKQLKNEEELDVTERS